MEFDENKLILRQASLQDVEYLATAIIEAEKSATKKIGPANYFEITEEQYRQYMIAMLEEEVNGCELSISSFVVAEYEGEVVAALGGWLEGENEDNMPSAILKANLYAYILPSENLKKGQEKYDIVKGIQIEREAGAYQLENVYTSPNFRGHHIAAKLNSYHMDLARKMGATKVQLHLFGSNEKSIKACGRSGFRTVKVYKSDHPLVKDYYPDDTMFLRECQL